VVSPTSPRETKPISFFINPYSIEKGSISLPFFLRPFPSPPLSGKSSAPLLSNVNPPICWCFLLSFPCETDHVTSYRLFLMLYIYLCGRKRDLIIKPLRGLPEVHPSIHQKTQELVPFHQSINKHNKPCHDWLLAGCFYSLARTLSLNSRCSFPLANYR